MDNYKLDIISQFLCHSRKPSHLFFKHEMKQPGETKLVLYVDDQSLKPFSVFPKQQLLETPYTSFSLSSLERKSLPRQQGLWNIQLRDTRICKGGHVTVCIGKSLGRVPKHLFLTNGTIFENFDFETFFFVILVKLCQEQATKKFSVPVASFRFPP